MLSTDEHGLTQPTAQQEQDWTEANDSPEGPEPTDPAPSESLSPPPAEPPEDLPF